MPGQYILSVSTLFAVQTRTGIKPIIILQVAGLLFFLRENVSYCYHYSPDLWYNFKACNRIMPLCRQKKCIKYILEMTDVRYRADRCQNRLINSRNQQDYSG